MSTFPFFSNRRKDITQLVEQSKNLFDASSQQKFAIKVGSVFDPLVEQRLSKTERMNEPLRLVIHFELCGLICSLPPADTYFVEHYKIVLDELIKACRWKQLISDIPFAELAERSASRQTDISRWITRFRERQKPGQLKRLALMLTEKDQQAVAYRTLRTFLAFLNHQPAIESKALFWLRDGRVQLRFSLLREYLFEQIAFRVYMFHTASEASFIEESLSDVKNWVRARVAERTKGIGPELEDGINDIVSTVKLEFITKCQRKKSDPEAFYLDSSLATFLIGFVKRKRAIDKLLGEQQQEVKDDEQAVQEANPENDFIDTDELPDDTYFFDAPDPWEDQRNILRRCLQLLEEKCRDLIMRHFNDSFSSTIPFKTLALELNESAKSLESRYHNCMEKLTKMVLGAYNK